VARFPYLASCLPNGFRVVCAVLVLAINSGDFIRGREKKSEVATHVSGKRFSKLFFLFYNNYYYKGLCGLCFYSFISFFISGGLFYYFIS